MELLSQPSAPKLISNVLTKQSFQKLTQFSGIDIRRRCYEGINLKLRLSIPQQRSHQTRRLICCSSSAPSLLPSTPAALDVKGLNLSLQGSQGRVQVLKQCSLRIPEGQLWMLLGPNGCGKSTFLKTLAGLLRPDGGRMRVAGPRSFVFQNPDHQVVMPTVSADVAFGLGSMGLPEEDVKQRVENALRVVGMLEHAQRAVQTLSGGQKQRVAIAGALAEQSKVLLLDELTTFLDQSDQVGVLEAIRNVVEQSEGVTALWVTHRLEELSYADGAVYMEDGRVVVAGGVAEVEKYILKQQEAVLGSGGTR